MRKIKLRAYYGVSQKFLYLNIGQQMTDIQRAIYSKICINGGEWYQFTGFFDKNGEEIYDGVNLTDEVDCDGEIVNSKYKVFWNQPTGSWHLDISRNQDETESTELWMELNYFEYGIIDNK